MYNSDRIQTFSNIRLKPTEESAIHARFSMRISIFEVKKKKLATFVTFTSFDLKPTSAKIFRHAEYESARRD